MDVVPVFNLDLCPPADMEFDMVGMSISPPRSVSGRSRAIEFTGGGLWTVTYRDCMIYYGYQHRYYSWLSGYLSGSIRLIAVPLINDWIAPVPNDGDPIFVTGITHSDGSTFSDGTGYRESTIRGRLESAVEVNQGTIDVRISEGGEIVGGEVFSVFHDDVGWRAYRIIAVDTWHSEGEAKVYTVGISPPMRGDAGNESICRFSHPLVTVAFPSGFKAPYAPTREVGHFEATLEFVEAF